MGILPLNINSDPAEDAEKTAEGEQVAEQRSIATLKDEIKELFKNHAHAGKIDMTVAEKANLATRSLSD